VSREAFFRELDRLDGQRRPLIAMVLADAMATSSDFSGLDDLPALLRARLKRDRNHLWPASLQVADTPIGSTAPDLVIAFATIIGGLGIPELTALDAALQRPIDRLWSGLITSGHSDVRSLNPNMEFQGKDDEYALFYAFQRAGAVEVLARGPSRLASFAARSPVGTESSIEWPQRRGPEISWLHSGS
jgi:hypothetical protein